MSTTRERLCEALAKDSPYTSTLFAALCDPVLVRILAWHESEVRLALNRLNAESLAKNVLLPWFGGWMRPDAVAMACAKKVLEYITEAIASKVQPSEPSYATEGEMRACHAGASLRPSEEDLRRAADVLAKSGIQFVQPSSPSTELAEPDTEAGEIRLRLCADADPKAPWYIQPKLAQDIIAKIACLRAEVARLTAENAYLYQEGKAQFDRIHGQLREALAGELSGEGVVKVACRTIAEVRELRAENAALKAQVAKYQAGKETP